MFEFRQQGNELLNIYCSSIYSSSIISYGSNLRETQECLLSWNILVLSGCLRNVKIGSKEKTILDFCQQFASVLRG